MNRRFFFKTGWFSIIVISQAYIEQATDGLSRLRTTSD